MSIKDKATDIAGYRQAAELNALMETIGPDYTAWQGRVACTIAALHPPHLRLRVSEAWQATPSTRVLRLVNPNGLLPPFLAGQYISIGVDIGGVRTSRAYSIASSPHQSAYYEIAVRRVADGFVSDHLVDLLQPGNELDCQGPAGTFFHNPLFHGDDVVFLAGGSGITPFASMIREVTDRGLGRRIQLIYGNRVPEDVLYQADFEERAGRHNNFRCDLVISEPPAGYLGHTGFMTAELIASLVKRPLEKMFYLCGPEAMYTLCRAALEQLGVPRRRIRSEVFRPARVITAEPGWPPEISAEARFSVQVGRKSISARAGEPLLAALERAGLTPPSSCRAGECSLCRTRLVSGRVFQPAPVKLRKADRRFGYIHPCMAYPLADVVLEI